MHKHRYRLRLPRRRQPEHRPESGLRGLLSRGPQRTCGHHRRCPVHEGWAHQRKSPSGRSQGLALRFASDRGVL